MSEQIKPAERRPPPDIIDVFIILLLAAALDIFIFWMGTQFVANPVFQTLPKFVTNFYSGIWASVATGTAGIGLVIVKAVASRKQSYPNYFLYVSTTAAGLFLAILALALVSIAINNKGPLPPKPAPPFQSFLLDFPADGIEQIFDLSKGTPDIIYKYKGKAALNNRTLTGNLESSKLTITALFRPLFPMEIQRVEINSCHWRFLNGFWSVDWSPERANVKNSIEVSKPMNPSSEITFSPVPFRIDIPEDATLKETWLCIRLNWGGGYYPIP